MSKLGDFVRVQGGYAFKSSELSDDKTGVPVIKIGNITGGSFVDLSNYQSVSFQLFEKTKSFATKDNDILIAMTGANVGKTSRVPVNSDAYLINQRVGRFLLKEDCPYTSDFIYYVVSSKQAYQYFSRVADGAAQPNISGKTIEDLEFPNIDSRCANKIGNILKSLDDKTQLNTQINQTLEQIAQTIFKSWFIDFDPVHAKANALASGQTLEQATQAAMAVISGKNTQELHRLQTANPEQYQQLWEIAEAFPSGFDEEGVPWGWEEKPLPELIDFLEGPGIRNWQYTEEEDGIKFINIRCIKNGDLSLETANKITREEAFGKYAHFQLKEDDIVISTSGTLGRFALVRNEHLPLCLNTSVIRFRPIENKSTLAFLLGLASNQLQYELEARASGSVQRNFGPTHLKQISVLLPDFYLLSLHNKYISTLFELRKSNLRENDLLMKTRDVLLPKLLSGEV
ncbi:restriction endonuclease subunit S [Glaesserella parasuis]|uniref:restriction endonuclease subunit S n=1 Tax=Glaesserella parasuis TaxID=738 RepID=UPI0003ABFEE9|nr:restriction endonuclease subunit S [Glaesserella parasuis]EQA14061.1 type I restriction modification DNA specificity domain protein [Glaesserella parasuis H465]MDG6227260.1 restriction endonuclease subunit S [Glaesserella parasuis]MDG6301112.1 restriction endonuclease subunit S [Glaesserella parasuis]MDG6322898.1 restriction endonuclease subunit S [Glaesserella parasuis]MDG6376183.1 restriction endonuclease subunit S [Glaesserella parasuis]